jgi:peptide/nickel transport system substrate-binding protein
MLRILLLIVALVVAPAWRASAESTLHLAYEVGYGGAETMDPYDGNRFWPPIDMVFSRLAVLDAKGEPAPALALSWSPSADLKTWTIKLRPGVRFHDGRPMTADDVIYSFQRMIDPKFDSPVRAVLGVISQARALDPLTVELQLATAEADLPLLLTDYRAVITPKDSQSTIAKKPIGTGPFKMETAAPEGTTVLAANADYFNGKPGVDRVELIAIPDSAARVQALQAGQIDMLDSIDAKQLPLFAGNPQFTIQRIATGNWNGLVMRTDTAPFTDARVRKALRIAADRSAVINLVLGKEGGVVACDSPVWPGDPYSWDGHCGRDVEGARKLLAEAGFPGGIDVDLYTSDVEESFITLAQAYQAQAAAAGIRVNLVMAAASGYWDDIWLKKPFVVTSWDQRPATQALNEIYRSDASWNETAWKQPGFDALLDQARAEPDPAKRKALYQKLQQILFEEGGSFIPYFKNVARVYRANVKNAEPTVDDRRWEKITVE